MLEENGRSWKGKRSATLMVRLEGNGLFWKDKVVY